MDANSPEGQFRVHLDHAEQLLARREFDAAVKAYEEAAKILPDRDETEAGLARVYRVWGDALVGDGELLEAQRSYRLGLRHGEEPRVPLQDVQERILKTMEAGLRIAVEPAGEVIARGDCTVRVALEGHPLERVRVNGKHVTRSEDGSFTYAWKGLTDGDHRLEVESTDSGGNSVVHKRSIVVDTRPPSVAGYQPNDGTKLLVAQVVIEGEANERITDVWTDLVKEECEIRGKTFRVTVPVRGLFPKVHFGVIDCAGHRSEVRELKLYNPTWVPDGLEAQGVKFHCEKDGATMVRVPSVEFIFRDDRGRPRRARTHPYFVDVTEVTNAQYGRFLKWVRGATNPREYAHPSQPLEKDHTPSYWNDPELSKPDRPVVGVDWWDAYAYAAWAGKSLLTDETWVLAARGVPEAVYPWGDAAPQHAYANYAGGRESGPVAVTSMVQGRSPFGCYEMAGNVMEWCGVPHGASTRKLVRGGSWKHPARFLRISTRQGLMPATRARHLGFRCAKFLTTGAPTERVRE